MHALLESIGLSPLEAIIYTFICQSGLSSASKISRLTGVQRSMCYIVLANLTEKKLVHKDTTRKVARFGLTNPEFLANFVKEREAAAKQADTAYHSVIEQIKQQFAIQSGQPGVRFYSGTEGLQALYKDINESGSKELYIVRSHVPAEGSMLELLQDQVQTQIHNRVQVRVINSSNDLGITKYLTLDNARLTERRILPHEIFQNPSQIIIYDNKVGFTTYRNPMMTVVIEHEDIATTMRSLYSYIWKKADTDTKHYLTTH